MKKLEEILPNKYWSEIYKQNEKQIQTSNKQAKKHQKNTQQEQNNKINKIGTLSEQFQIPNE